jgi:hypothetical protein
MIYLGLFIIVVGVWMEWNARSQMAYSIIGMRPTLLRYFQVLGGWFLSFVGLAVVLFAITGYTLRSLLPGFMSWW